jgi:hypothetical protein
VPQSCNTVPEREKLCRGITPARKNSAGKNYVPILILHGKNSVQNLKRPENYCPEIWDRIFPTGYFTGRSFPFPVSD